MSSYVERSLATNDSVPEICCDALNTVKDLDEMTKELASYLDQVCNKTATTKGGKKVTQAKVSVSLSSKDSIKRLRSLIDDLAVRKVTLAMHTYDVLDQATRAVDEDVKHMEKAVELSANDMQPILDVYNGVKATDTCGGISLVGASEPLYCICHQVAFGEMISCDNDDCEHEWFHYACVGLTKPPRGGEWLCPMCVQKLDRGKQGTKRKR